MKAVFLDLKSLDDLALEALHAQFASLTLYDQSAPEQVLERIGDAEVVITNKALINAQTLQQAPNLKLVCVVATGVNNVDLEAAKAQGIAVYNCQGYGIPAVVQHTFSLMLALHTQLLSYHQAVRAGRWQTSDQFCLLDYPIQELYGKTVGILGYGALGQGVAKIAEAFGMKVLVAARPGSESAPEGRILLPELLAQVDVLSIHCPLTDATRNVIDANALALMKPSAFVVNVARGGIVDEQALADALRQNRLAGAATDVLSQEPPVAGNPLLADDIPNLIVTPHSAWGSFEARQRIIDQTVANVQAFKQASEVRRVA